MTTHRAIQIHNLLDALESKARTARRAAENLARIKNDRGAGHYLRRVVRYERISATCRARLAG